MGKLYILVAVVAVASGVLVTGACMSREEPAVPFLICWNYDTSGYLETCGCSSHQLGGLGRRASKIADLREKQPVLLIEGAHLVEAVGEFQLFKGETVIRALNAMGYHAVMFGLREGQQGRDGLKRLRELSAAPCFSANLTVDGQAWPASHVLVDIAGQRVGITGASQPEAVSFELPPEVAFADPAACIEAAIGELAEADIVVVCLEGEETWIAAMMRRFRGSAQLFLTGNRTAATASLEFTSDPPRLNNWELGKYLGVVAVDPAGDSTQFAGVNVPLDETLESDPAIEAIFENEYKPYLKERFFTRMKADIEQLYLPPDSCQPCHEAAYQSYAASRHAQALITLQATNEVYNPDCMACHVVYDPGTDELKPMNCIVCHGNITEQHLWDAVEGKVVRPATPVVTYTYESCAVCHNELNSLPFLEHWPQYVNRIYHGGDDTAARAAAEQMGLDYQAAPPDIASHTESP